MDPETALVEGIPPKTFLEVGEDREAWGSGSTPYTLSRHSDHYRCTCPAWTYKKGGPLRKTCKHLQALLGEEYENLRITLAGGEASSPASSPKKRKAPASSSSSTSSPTKKAKSYMEVMLAETFSMTGKVDPAGWWMSEKLDGVRAYWNGEVLCSRKGNIFEAPSFFKDMLPTDIQLDGELWMARDAFDRTSGIVRKGAAAKKSQWESIAFMVFDVFGDNDPVEKRWAKLEERFGVPMSPSDALVKGVGGTVVVLKQEKCESLAHLTEELKKIESVGGEGIMLRKAGSKYEHKRSKNLLKVKSFYDAEAVVIRHEDGEGKNAGRMGSLRCRMESGLVFKVGTGFKDVDRDNPPEIGAVINYKFQELSQEGTPRFPVYVGVAADKTEAKDAVVRSTALRAVKKEGSSKDL